VVTATCRLVHLGPVKPQEVSNTTHLFYGLLGVDGSWEVVGNKQGMVEDEVDG
jgi:hypothetical protein